MTALVRSQQLCKFLTHCLQWKMMHISSSAPSSADMDVDASVVLKIENPDEDKQTPLLPTAEAVTHTRNTADAVYSRPRNRSCCTTERPSQAHSMLSQEARIEAKLALADAKKRCADFFCVFYTLFHINCMQYHNFINLSACQ